MMKNKNVHSDNELADIVRANKKNSGSAFEELYDRYSDKIYRYVLLAIGNKEMASDILQEVFIAFYAKLHEYHIENVKAFLFGVARNHIYKYRSKTRIELSVVDMDEVLESDYGMNYESEDLYRMLLNALAVLEGVNREAYILREFNGLSYPEIAEILEISVEASRTRVHRAQLKLKEILSPIINELNRF